MPNWCSNSLELFHEDPEAIEKVVVAINDGKLFQTIVPLGEDDHPTEKWGTKWEAGINDSEADVDHVQVYFDTAWSPPIAFYEALEEQGFNVYANYYEPGLCFCGEYKDGEDYYYDYSDCTSEDIVDLIGQELDDIFGLSEILAEMEREEEEDV